MRKKTVNKHIDELISSATRYTSDYAIGLTSDQVLDRKENYLVNISRKKVTKTYGQILKDNLLNFFNLLLIAIAILIIYGGYYDSLFFLVVLFLNIGIGLFQDIRARHLVDKLRLVSAPSAVVVRNKEEMTIPISELVLDDIVILKAGDQISADSIVVNGSIAVDESLLTGESIDVVKNVGDVVCSGTYVKSGKAYVRVDKIGAANYVEKLQDQSREFKRPKSEILKSITSFFRVIGAFVILCGILNIVCSAVKGNYSSVESFRTSIGPLAGSLVAMIPSGMYLLTSIALTLGVIRLAKRKTLVQELYCIEMLARVNILCLDKTGTLTDGAMIVKDMKSIGNISEKDLSLALANYIGVNDEDNSTGRALKDKFGKKEAWLVEKRIAFDSKNKYSAVTFKDHGTYVLGAAEMMDIKDKTIIEAEINNYASKGYRVLLLAHSSEPITKDKIPNTLTPLGLVILQDHIKDDAKDTINWFVNNDVQIRIISGDNALTASEIAKDVGVPNADHYISLEGMSLDEVRKVACSYNVFGRVTPEQKEVIIESLREAKNCVAMTGDGVNDILALKRADCSIAMANGSDAAKNVSHLVMLDSNFASLPSVVEEGRRVINNLQKTSSLFLVKTIFAIFTSLLFIVIGFAAIKEDIVYPFFTNNLYLWELFTIGLGSFFLALQPNKERLKGTFSNNIIRKAVPGSITIVFAVLFFFMLNLIESYIPGSTQVYYNNPTLGNNVVAMSVVAMTFLSLIYLLRMCWPFNKYRIVLFSAITVAIAASFILVYFTGWNILKINLNDISTFNCLAELLPVMAGFTAVYFGLDYLFNRNL